MTNREWLSTLTDEEFVSWLIDKTHTTFSFVQVNGEMRIKGLKDKVFPRMEEIIKLSTSTRHALLDWLKQERVELMNIEEDEE